MDLRCSSLLPTDFKPTGKDIICGRARENFHHDGNRYFRDLIQKNVGPYLVARTKIEKGEAIAMIVDKVQQNSPLGGFIKRDNVTGRWYRITDTDARDKVGHAIRKAVQRLEETKPKLAARLKKEFASCKRPASSLSTATSSIKRSPGRDFGLTEPMGRKDATDNSVPATGAAVTAEKSTTIETGRMEAVSALKLHRSPRREENDERSGNYDKKENSRFLQPVLAASMPTLSDGTSLGTTSLPIGRFTASRYPFRANASHNFQPELDNLLLMDSARLLAAQRLLESNPVPPLVQPYDNLFGLSDVVQRSTAAAEKFWLSAAIREQGEQAQRVRELEYTRELTLSALAIQRARAAPFLYPQIPNRNRKLEKLDDKGFLS